MTDLPPTLPERQLKPIVARHTAPSPPVWREPVAWLAAAVVAVGFAGVVLYVNSVSHQAHHDANAPCVARDKRAACVAAAKLQAGLSQANRQATAHGLPPVSTPATVPVPTVTVTAANPPVITDAMLDATADRYFKLHPPPPGKAAVVDYQALRAFIVAQIAHITPSPGPPGASGASGQVGEQGPGLTQAQADQAFADWCSARNDCIGPIGPSGSPGPTGQTGPTGPTGATGPAGPPCPTGYTQATVTPHPLESPGETWVICDSTTGG